MMRTMRTVALVKTGWHQGLSTAVARDSCCGMCYACRCALHSLLCATRKTLEAQAMTVSSAGAAPAVAGDAGAAPRMGHMPALLTALHCQAFEADLKEGFQL
jgi:hypothetical protein